MDLLTHYRIVPDVIDAFEPELQISLSYDGQRVENGSELKPSKATGAPRVKLMTPRVGCLYTLIMVDPDAPSPDEPKMREWVHWIVTNIPAAQDISDGEEVLAYAGPTPPRGVHRYAVLVFEQAEGKTQQASAPYSRGGFKTREWVHTYKMRPVGGMLYRAQKD